MWVTSAIVRPCSKAEVTAYLLKAVRGDESKLGACYMVDMLCFEERLFLEAGEV